VPNNRSGSGDIQYSVPVDWSRYQSRVETLLKLHNQVGVSSIFDIAEKWFGLSPIQLAQWATNDQALQNNLPQDKVLAAMLRDIRSVFEERKRELGPITWVHLLDEFVTMIPRIEVSYNWAPYDAHMRKEIRGRHGAKAFKACTKMEVDNGREPTLPVGIPAFVTIRVPLSPMKTWGLDQIVNQIKGVIRDALKNCPSRKEAPGMVGTIPPKREFLVNAHDSALEKDIERFKLYMNQALSFRQIAYLEFRRRDGKAIDVSTVPKAIRAKVAGESAVCESVTRIYEAIYLKPFTGSRRRRLDAPGQGMSVYDCPQHDQDCSKGCGYMKSWLKKVSRILPTDFTGSGRRMARAKSRRPHKPRPNYSEENND
jgi:hypothetical protein